MCICLQHANDPAQSINNYRLARKSTLQVRTIGTKGTFFLSNFFLFFFGYSLIPVLILFVSLRGMKPWDRVPLLVLIFLLLINRPSPPPDEGGGDVTISPITTVNKYDTNFCDKNPFLLVFLGNVLIIISLNTLPNIAQLYIHTYTR